MKRYLTFVAMIVAGFQSVSAQIAVNPVEPSGTGDWTMSLNGNYMHQMVGGQNTISRRILLKSSWGLTPWLDLYVLGGAVQLEMESGSENVEDYTDHYRVAYGLGCHLVLPLSEMPFMVFAGAQAMRFTSSGSYNEGFWIDADYYQSRYDLSYDWREAKFQAGAAIPFGMFRIFGAATWWGLQRLDVKKEYQVYGETETYIGKDEGEYRTGLIYGTVIGVQLNFPGRYALTAEVLFFNKDEYHLLVGVSQTGMQ